MIVNNKPYDASLKVQNILFSHFKMKHKFSKHLLKMINQVIFLSPFIIITL